MTSPIAPSIGAENIDGQERLLVNGSVIDATGAPVARSNAFSAGPAPSPFSTSFDRTAVPRIRTSHLPWHSERDFCAEFWLHELKQHPETRYVSDGDPLRITFPHSEQKHLAARFRALANAY